MSDQFVRDQNGVVWWPHGFMSRTCYEILRTQDMPAYDDLPPWDSRQQTIVEVDE